MSILLKFVTASFTSVCVFSALLSAVLSDVLLSETLSVTEILFSAIELLSLLLLPQPAKAAHTQSAVTIAIYRLNFIISVLS